MLSNYHTATIAEHNHVAPNQTLAFITQCNYFWSNKIVNRAVPECIKYQIYKDDQNDPNTVAIFKVKKFK